MQYTETIPKNSCRNKKTEVIKGNRGEQIVYEFLIRKGWIVYKPVSDGGHCFDFLATKDRKELRIIEVKTKPKRLYYPDNGIEYRHYEEYKRIMAKHNLELFLAFVDEDNGEIYGNFLEKLEEPKIINVKGKAVSYPYRWSNIIFFPIENMLTIVKLNDEDIEFLRAHSKRNYEYAR